MKGKRSRSRASYLYQVHTATVINKPEGVGQVDHIVPKSFGFKHDIPPVLIGSRENLQRLSPNENMKKGQRITPEAIAILREWGEKIPRLADLADVYETKIRETFMPIKKQGFGAQCRYNHKRPTVAARTPSVEWKERLQAEAEKAGQSVGEYIVQAVEERINR